MNYALPASLRYLSFATAHPGILPEWHLPVVSFLSENFSAARQVSSKSEKPHRTFVVESLRDEDCFSKSRTAYTVTHIFSAPNDAKKYTTLLFMDENAMIDSLPDEIKNMLDQTLLHK